MTAKTYPAKETSIPDIQRFVRDIYQKAKCNKRTILEYELLSEEILLKLIESAKPEGMITVCFDKKLGGNKLVFSCEGEPLDLEKAVSEDISLKIIMDYAERLSQTRRHGTNYITLTTNTSSDVMSKQLMISTLLAVTTCIMLYLILNLQQINWVVTQISGALSFVFVKLLQCFAVPVAFLSLITYIINYHESVEYDKDLKKVSLRFIFSSIFAILIAFVVWKITESFLGSLLFFKNIQTNASAGLFFGDSVSDFIIQIIPENLLEIFTLSNPLPMLVVAIIMGLGVNSYSSRSNTRLRNGLNDLMDLLSHLISMIFALLPLFLYFSVVHTILYRLSTGELKISLIVIAGSILVIIICFLIQYIFYSIQLYVVGISPVTFFRKYKDMLLENFKIASNIDALPYNQRTFRRKFGKKGYTPLVRSALNLGTLMNMDGNCLIITMSILIFNHFFGVSLSTMKLIELFVIILLLGIGSPNQPGSYTIATIVLISFLGIDIDYAGIIVIIEAVFCKLYSATNAFGDIVTVVSFADDELKKKKRKVMA